MSPPDNIDEVPAHEWHAQESALRMERGGSATSADTGDIARYRLIARLLRAPLPISLPEDFAVATAQRAELLAAVADEGIEQWLQYILLSSLCLGGLVGALLLDWRALLAMLSTGAVRWVLAAALCLGASRLIDRCCKGLRPLPGPS